MEGGRGRRWPRSPSSLCSPARRSRVRVPSHRSILDRKSFLTRESSRSSLPTVAPPNPRPDAPHHRLLGKSPDPATRPSPHPADSTEPLFHSGYPTTSSVTGSQFDLEVKVSTRIPPRDPREGAPTKKQIHQRTHPEPAFFFQAEDGIRDLRMSRGLGDVYKRQNLGDILDRSGAYMSGSWHDTRHFFHSMENTYRGCLLYTSDAADEP